VIVETGGALAVAESLRKKASRRAPPTKTGGLVLKPKTTLHAEDEEQ
jgi:hypothetical protein